MDEIKRFRNDHQRCRPAGNGTQSPAGAGPRTPRRHSPWSTHARTSPSSPASTPVGEVPPAYAALFAGRQALLDTHRGWDPGALELGRQMADAFGVTAARHHHDTPAGRAEPLDRPPRAVLRVHAPLAAGAARRRSSSATTGRIVTPSRPRSPATSQRAGGWCMSRRTASRRCSTARCATPTSPGCTTRGAAARPSSPAPGSARCAALAPDLRLRRNYPYRGRDDGLVVLAAQAPCRTTQYLGLELEVNQRFVEQGGAPWERLRAVVVESLLRRWPIRPAPRGLNAAAPARLPLQRRQLVEDLARAGEPLLRQRVEVGVAARRSGASS